MAFTAWMSSLPKSHVAKAAWQAVESILWTMSRLILAATCSCLQQEHQHQQHQHINGDIPLHRPYIGLIWYSTSILGSWNSHWTHIISYLSRCWGPQGIILGMLPSGSPDLDRRDLPLTHSMVQRSRPNLVPGNTRRRTTTNILSWRRKIHKTSMFFFSKIHSDCAIFWDSRPSQDSMFPKLGHVPDCTLW